MEEPMSALTDRQQARDRLNKVFQSILDKVVPLDESVPLPGKKFVDWEELADEVDRTLVPTFPEERAPQKLLSTCVATMAEAAVFGVLARLEAEKRGIRQAVEVIGIHDGGNWIDPLWEEHFGCHVRILDYYHAAEHLNDVARAVHASDEQAVKRLAEELVSLLWEGKTDLLLGRLRELSAEAGPPRRGGSAVRRHQTTGGLSRGRWARLAAGLRLSFIARRWHYAQLGPGWHSPLARTATSAGCARAAAA
jgi:hypothetical protein